MMHARVRPDNVMIRSFAAKCVLTPSHATVSLYACTDLYIYNEWDRLTTWHGVEALLSKQSPVIIGDEDGILHIRVRVLQCNLSCTQLLHRNVAVLVTSCVLCPAGAC